jgi:hypothetical protein
MAKTRVARLTGLTERSMDGRPFSAQQLLVFCRRAKREHAALFEQWDPAQVRVPEAEVLARAGKEHVSGYLYDHTRDALVSKAVALSRGLAIDAAMTKAEVCGFVLLIARWLTGAMTDHRQAPAARSVENGRERAGQWKQENRGKADDAGIDKAQGVRAQLDQ